VSSSKSWQLRETGSTPATPPATSTATNPRQHRPKDLNKIRRDIHLVKIKYCEDTRPQNQLNAAKQHHKDLSYILQLASVTLHIILLGVGCTIYNTNTLKPFKELGLDSQRVKKLASKLHVHSVHRSRFQAKPATLLIPIVISFLFAVEELYGTRYQNGSFSLINVGSDFNCQHSFFIFLLFHTCFFPFNFRILCATCRSHRESHQILRPYRLPWSFGGMQAIASKARESTIC